MPFYLRLVGPVAKSEVGIFDKNHLLVAEILYRHFFPRIVEEIVVVIVVVCSLFHDSILRMKRKGQQPSPFIFGLDYSESRSREPEPDWLLEPAL